MTTSKETKSSQQFKALIKKAAENSLIQAEIKAEIVVTPSTLSIMGIATEAEAQILETAFIKTGMKSLSFVDMAEIGMGKGYDLTILI